MKGSPGSPTSGPGVPDEAADHYNKQQLAALIVSSAVVNARNRITVTTKQVAGEWAGSTEARTWVGAARPAAKRTALRG